MEKSIYIAPCLMVWLVNRLYLAAVSMTNSKPSVENQQQLLKQVSA